MRDKRLDYVHATALTIKLDKPGPLDLTDRDRKFLKALLADVPKQSGRRKTEKQFWIALEVARSHHAGKTLAAARAAAAKHWNLSEERVRDIYKEHRKTILEKHADWLVDRRAGMAIRDMIKRGGN